MQHGRAPGPGDVYRLPPRPPFPRSGLHWMSLLLMQWIRTTALVCRYWLRRLQSADVVLNVYKRALRHALSVMWCNMHYCQHNCQYSGKNICGIRPLKIRICSYFLGMGMRVYHLSSGLST